MSEKLRVGVVGTRSKRNGTAQRIVFKYGEY